MIIQDLAWKGEHFNHPVIWEELQKDDWLEKSDPQEAIDFALDDDTWNILIKFNYHLVVKSMIQSAHQSPEPINS